MPDGPAEDFDRRDLKGISPSRGQGRRRDRDIEGSRLLLPYRPVHVKAGKKKDPRSQEKKEVEASRYLTLTYTQGEQDQI